MQLFVKDKAFYKTAVHIALPVAAQQTINIGVNMMDTIMLGSFGEIQLSASSLANQFLMVADVLFLWIASVPLGYFAGLVWSWPPFAVYFCLRIDFVIKSFWCVHRLRGRKWIRQVYRLEG